jgi:hypothetical protein
MEYNKEGVELDQKEKGKEKINAKSLLFDTAVGCLDLLHRAICLPRPRHADPHRSVGDGGEGDGHKGHNPTDGQRGLHSRGYVPTLL